MPPPTLFRTQRGHIAIELASVLGLLVPPLVLILVLLGNYLQHAWQEELLVRHADLILGTGYSQPEADDGALWDGHALHARRQQ
ncbi:MAG: hypothetical protein WAV92_10120 [Halopseudomonas yangmingensis]